MNLLTSALILVARVAAAQPADTVVLKVGFIHKLKCEGKLYLSAVGNDNLVRLEALPKELGCAVVLKPLGSVGTTNLLLETSVGSSIKTLRVVSGSRD